MRGGRRDGAGRKPGSLATKTVDRFKKSEAMQAAANEAIPKAFQGDAHAFLVTVYKDPANPMKDRLAAATAAISYEKPKLSSVDAKIEAEVDATLTVSRIELVAPSLGTDEHAAH